MPLLSALGSECWGTTLQENMLWGTILYLKKDVAKTARKVARKENCVLGKHSE